MYFQSAVLTGSDALKENTSKKQEKKCIVELVDNQRAVNPALQ